jgi:Protein of unknown function (DUF2786)
MRPPITVLWGSSRGRSVGPDHPRGAATIGDVALDELHRAAPARNPSLTEAARLLRTAALARAIDEPSCADRIVPLLRGRIALRPHTVDLAADTAIREAAHDILTHGWTPAEVHRFAASRLDPAALGYLVDALATTAQWSAGAPWLSELRGLGARVWWTVGDSHLAQWSQRHGVGRAEALRVAVDVLALLSYLPRTDRPMADSPAVTLPPGAAVHDRRIVGRIDRLLHRATSTEYPAEASACADKAQDLLLRHAIVPAVRRTVLTDPRRIVAVVGGEVAGLLQRAATVFNRRPRPRPRPALAAPEHRPLPSGNRRRAQAPNGRSW